MGKYFFTCAMMVLGMHLGYAQHTKKAEMLEQRKAFSDRTMFQRFEREMVPTAAERTRKREKIKARRDVLLTIIDTSQIRPELKLRLKNDVLDDPFSNRLRKFMEKHKLKEIVLAH
ncbi:hypothetical protein L0P88_21435 [Muricauda sp. SCSIO 64092]|uniref:hypothetical protein n=1 Tax=Allomuricauda sp. SCSIO 64092 TaxID=2908842 RepID=UPI001FF1EA56|nr:hypothetical protein [Muricauda sp. SCSIO 64092]UOY06473.1 hypothetical protein L0P88_21435 [Muricauda sp. SCSIO 64092]